jgi:hypothetical protein
MPALELPHGDAVELPAGADIAGAMQLSYVCYD